MSSTVEQVNSNRELKLIGGLSIASIVIFINLYLVQGMLPLIAGTFSVSKSHATLLLSVTSFTMAFSLLLFAVMSDRIGRKRPILISLYLLVIVDIVAIFIADFSQLVALRMVQGALLASVPAMAMAFPFLVLALHLVLCPRAGNFFLCLEPL